MTELTAAHIAAQDKAEAFIRGQLASSEPTTLSVAKEEFLQRYKASLADHYKDNPDGLNQKIQAASAELDEQLIANVRAGAIDPNADATAFKGEDPQRAQAREGFRGLINNVIGFIANMLGGIGNIIMSILSFIPGVNNFISESAESMTDAYTGTSGADRAKETLAAGVANALQAPIDIGTETFSLENSGKIFRDFMKELNKPADAGERRATTASPEALAQATQAGRQVAAAGASGPAEAQDAPVPPQVTIPPGAEAGVAR